MPKKDDEPTARRFAATRGRQLAAIALSVLLIIVLAIVSTRPDLFGALSKKQVLIILVLIMLLFINFSSWNWRCPSCRSYLGSDLLQEKCRKCGARLRK
jgi:SNF family Na+-dependent transporter